MKNKTEITTWLDRPINTLFRFNIENTIILILILLAIVSRFYQVEQRVISFDETNHVVPAYDLYQGRGYQYNPVTHGPLKFHLMALSYFMLGDSDFSSRLPVVLFSIATIAFVALAFRRYLGRIGTLVAAILFLISPLMLFYGRYIRDEAFVVFFEVLILYAVLRYFEKGDKVSLITITVAAALNFCAEETAFIFIAQLLLFLLVFYIHRLSQADWSNSGRMKQIFQFLMGMALFWVITSLALSTYHASTIKPSETENVMAGAVETTLPVGFSMIEVGVYIFLGLAVVSGLGAVWTLIKSLGWKGVRSDRSFDLLMLIGTLILPLLVAFPIKLAHLDPVDYSNTGLIRSGLFLMVMAMISVSLGLWWKGKTWFIYAITFYAIYSVFYTTFFTNGMGLLTGMIGSLGYWLTQQSVQRGSQPLYYYALIPIPVYEFLATIGMIMAVVIGITNHKFSSISGFWVSKTDSPEDSNKTKETNGDHFNHPVPSLGLFIFMSLTALVAYSIAGEKMPWLTVYIILTVFLSAGWGFGYMIEKTPWVRIWNTEGFLAILLIIILISCLGMVIFSLTTPSSFPFQGITLPQLYPTLGFILSIMVSILSIGGIHYLLSNWQKKEIITLIGISILSGLAVLTARAAYNANYINYDNAKEYLVYAHSARGVKDILVQVEEISQRTTMGKDIVVAYDDDSLYPFWWYLRDYPNKKYFGDKPTNDIKNADLIISGDSTFNKIAPIIRNNFIAHDYIRLWWPNQDYTDLTPERIWAAFSNSQLRAGIFDIWLNRDYTQYAQATNNQNLTLENWQPSQRMKLYIRKDIVSEIWNYGSLAATQQSFPIDSYQNKIMALKPDLIIGTTGSGPGQLQSPHGLAAASDGSIYVVDSKNNRIQHFSEKGDLLNIWGTFADSSKTAAPGATFNEPWGIAVGPDGSVYVTDTWNHRVEKFSAKGEFLKMWGAFGQGETPTAFWGPRGVAVDLDGRVYITDTGNKRVVIFNSDGLFITQFGTSGLDAGQFDEPVGLALDKTGKVYVNDTWNQRVQVFEPSADKTSFFPIKQWPIDGWFGQSLDNKPFIAVEPSGNIWVTDPEGYRVLEFNPNGAFILGWGDYNSDVDGFGMASGVAAAPDGKIWISDGTNNRLLRFAHP